MNKSSMATNAYCTSDASLDVHSITPATFRFAGKFLPALRQGHGSTRLTIGGEFFRALVTPSFVIVGAPNFLSSTT